MSREMKEPRSAATDGALNTALTYDTTYAIPDADDAQGGSEQCASSAPLGSLDGAPVGPRPPAHPGGETDETDAEAIARLAAMPSIEYERVRIVEADRLRIRAAILDDEIKKRRTVSRQEEESTSPYRELAPWPEPVDGSVLLADLVSVLRTHAILPLHTDVAIALWAVMTFAIDHIHVAPILALCSPEKRCGKTTVMSLVDKVVHRPVTASNITPAALFRAIEAWQPTLLVDEADTFVRSNEELRGILNSGHTRTAAFVVRTVGEDYEPQRFSTWGAKCIALIGHLPDTLSDRSITIHLRRRLPHEKIVRLRQAPAGLFEDLSRRSARFVADHHLEFHRSVEVPEALNDRAADNWEPLLTIAAIAGGDWPERARLAALSISGADQEPKSLGVELLQDIRQILDVPGRDRIRSGDLLQALCREEDRPWATYNNGQPISARQVSTRLRDFGITVGTVRFGAVTAKGYTNAQFAEAFTRYLSQSDHQSVTPSQVSPGAVLRGPSPRNQDRLFSNRAGPEASTGAGCDGVTDVQPI